MRELVYFIATSIDGFIADSDGDFSAFPTAMDTLTTLFERYPETCPAHLRGPLGITAEPRRFDTVVMGNRTYAPAVAAGLTAGAYPHLRQIVVAHGGIPLEGGPETIAGDIAQQVKDLKEKPGRDIWLCGGASIAAQLIDVIDEIQVKINPVVMGRGIPLFGANVATRPLRCTDISALPGGVALITYRLTPRQEA